MKLCLSIRQLEKAIVAQEDKLAEALEGGKSGALIAAIEERLQRLVDNKQRLSSRELAKSERLDNLLAMATEAEANRTTQAEVQRAAEAGVARSNNGSCVSNPLNTAAAALIIR